MRSSAPIGAAALAALCLGFLSCRGDAAPGRGGAAAPAASASRLPRAQVRFDTPRGPWVVDVEVVSTPEERARGLMYRTDLPADHGMLFVFEQTMEHGFWMHNTLLSLDMIFLGEDRAVIGTVAHAQPRTDTPRTVGKPSRYVVEVLAGEAAAHAVIPGTRAAFIGVAE